MFGAGPGFVALARLFPALAVHFEEVEDHAAGQRVGFDEAHHDALAEAENAGADAQGLPPRVVARPGAAEGVRRYQPIGAAFIELDKDAEARHAGDAGGEIGAQPGAEIGRYVALPGIALGCHGAPFGL